MSKIKNSVQEEKFQIPAAFSKQNSSWAATVEWPAQFH
jgi:hypothetical protein